MKTSVPKTTRVPVYRRYTPIDAPPDFFVSTEGARLLRASNAVVPFRRGSALRLRTSDQSSADSRQPKNEEFQYKLRDESCLMGERTIEANADGDRRAMAATAGWKNPVLSTQSSVSSH
jgi:hypothetical protein